MPFTVDTIMERVGSTEPQRIIEYIREAFVKMSLLDKRDTSIKFDNIIEDQRQYKLPMRLIGIVGVSVLDTEESSELISETADRDFSDDTNWTNTDFASFGTDDDLSVSNDATGQSCYLDQDDIITLGKRYRYEYDMTLTSGTFQLQTVDNSHKLGVFAQGTDSVIEFIAPETSELKIVGISSSGTADFDNFGLRRRGINKYRRAARIVGEMGGKYLDHEAKGD